MHLSTSSIENEAGEINKHITKIHISNILSNTINIHIYDKSTFVCSQ